MSTKNKTTISNNWQSVEKTNIEAGRWYKIKAEAVSAKEGTKTVSVLVVGVYKEADSINFYVPDIKNTYLDTLDCWDTSDFVKGMTHIGPKIDLTAPK